MSTAPAARPSFGHRPFHPSRSGLFPASVDQPLDGRPEHASDADQGRASRIRLAAPHDLPGVPARLEPGEAVNVLVSEPGKFDQSSEAVAERAHVHGAQRCADVPQSVNQDPTGRHKSPVNPASNDMRPVPKRRGENPIATRIRSRIDEMGTSESKLAVDVLGWHRSVLSTTLRRLDEHPDEANIHGETLKRLELALGKSAQWILTGADPEGIRLATCEGWDEAAKVARERYEIPAEKIALVAETRLPRAVRYVDAALIRLLSDAL